MPTTVELQQLSESHDGVNWYLSGAIQNKSAEEYPQISYMITYDDGSQKHYQRITVKDLKRGETRALHVLLPFKYEAGMRRTVESVPLRR